MVIRKWLGRCRELWPESCFVGTIYILLVVLFGLLRGLLLWRRRRRWSVLLSCFYALVGLTLLMGLAEIEFYHAVGSRFNTLVLNAMGHPWRLSGLHWQAYPMWPYLALWGG